MKIRAAQLLTGLAAATALLVLVGCTASAESPPEGSTPQPTAEQSLSPSELPSPDELPGFANALEERDAFVKAQQLPMDGSLLVATTDAQQEFIAQQRAYVESIGGSWDAETESITLALAADACETSILNGHVVDLGVFTAHIATSPLFAALLPADLSAADRSQGERNVASIMVFGTTFMCPADGSQWEAAFAENYGG